MNGPIALGGACATGVLVGGTWLARWAVHPTHPARAAGRHRAPAPVAAPEPERNSVEALDIRLMHCPVQHRPTRHVAFALGGLMCLDCRHREA